MYEAFNEVSTLVSALNDHLLVGGGAVQAYVMHKLNERGYTRKQLRNAFSKNARRSDFDFITTNEHIPYQELSNEQIYHHEDLGDVIHLDVHGKEDVLLSVGRKEDYGLFDDQVRELKISDGTQEMMVRVPQLELLLAEKMVRMVSNSDYQAKNRHDIRLLKTLYRDEIDYELAQRMANTMTTKNVPLDFLRLDSGA